MGTGGMAASPGSAASSMLPAHPGAGHSASGQGSHPFCRPENHVLQCIWKGKQVYSPRSPGQKGQPHSALARVRVAADSPRWHGIPATNQMRGQCPATTHGRLSGVPGGSSRARILNCAGTGHDDFRACVKLRTRAYLVQRPAVSCKPVKEWARRLGPL